MAVTEETHLPLNLLMPGEEGNKLDVDASPDLKAVTDQFGPIGDPYAKRLKQLHGYDPTLTSWVKKSKINVRV